MMDTIFAPATAQGRAGVAVVRISGPEAHRAAVRLAGDLPEHGRALRRLRDAEGEVLDEALVLSFAAGRSFTGETVVELHLHGSPAVISAVLRVLGDNPALRPAEAGEFTRQAMENGRLDLARVEGLADLVDAETEAQRRQALRVLSGALGEKAEAWRSALIRAAALIEATIDFADEDVPIDVTPEVSELLSMVQAEMRRESSGVAAAERIRDGFEVAIIGAPNVGKSTLLNSIAGRDAAITSHVAGTTRDVIEVRMDLRGLPVTLLDTAGLRESDDIVEKIGIDRGRARAERADLRVHLLAAGGAPILEVQPGDLLRVGMADLHGDGISGLTGQGIDALLDEIAELLQQRAGTVGIAMRERHRLAMERATEYLQSAQELLPFASEVPDQLAEDLRSAVRAVDSLVGRVDVEDILDEIFSRFCIGK